MINIMYAVDPIKRIVKPMSGHAVTEQDHEASSLRFAFPDNIAGTGLDSTGTAVRVMYIRPDGGDPVAKTLTFYKHSGGYYLYDWDLQKSDLSKEGALVFSLCILDISGGEVSEWHTTPCEVRVLSTIHTDDSDEGDAEVTPTVKERVAVLESMIQRVASGAPIVVSSTSAMTDTEQIYVLSTDGEWYYHNGTAWVVGGTYGAVATDTTLTQSGIPADAETVGDAVSKINNEFDNAVYAYPYGIEPFQMSIFKRTQNLFSNFCYYRNKRYYRSRLSTSNVVAPRVTETLNYNGWLIRIKPNTTYTMGGLDFKLELLKLDFYLDKTINTVSDTEPNTITTGANSYWLCLTQRVGRDMSDWMLVEGDTYPAEYVSGKPQWVESLDDDEDDHSGITIAFMGDSITAGVATKKCYHQYIHDKYGFTCLNYGFGGSGFYRNSTSQNSGRVGQGVPGIAPATTPQNFFTPNNIVARLSELDADVVNLIVIFAGTNDWGNGVTIENYITGIESAFDYCLNNFPTIPVMVMTPIHRRGDTVQNSQGKTLREYADILIEECKKYSIPYIDTMTDAGIYPDNDTNKETYFVTDTSGLHPSASGHKRIANAVWERIAGKVL